MGAAIDGTTGAQPEAGPFISLAAEIRRHQTHIRQSKAAPETISMKLVPRQSVKPWLPDTVLEEREPSREGSPSNGGNRWLLWMAKVEDNSSRVTEAVLIGVGFGEEIPESG